MFTQLSVSDMRIFCTIKAARFENKLKNVLRKYEQFKRKELQRKDMKIKGRINTEIKIFVSLNKKDPV